MSKETIGITREIDKLGRLVIPKEYRELFKLYNRVEILATADGVLIRSAKYDISFTKRNPKDMD